MLLVRLLAFLGTTALALGASSFERDILPVLDRTCMGCHDADGDPEGGLNLERFATEAEALAHPAVWKAVFDKLESHQMPPPKRDAQPSDAERAQVLAWIETTLSRPDPQLGTQDPGKPVLRRLNRLEYNNTLRDLLGFDSDIFIFTERQPLQKDYFDPTAARMPDELLVRTIQYGGKWPVVLPQAGLPGDGRAEHGYNNRGDMLNLSGLLLESYLGVANELVRSPKLAKTPFHARFLAAPASGLDADALQAEAARRLEAFLPQAFRRPVSAAEAARFLGVYEASRAGGAGFEPAMGAVLQAILTSPSFLYRSEPHRPQQPAVRALDGYELASRLSYFLWASTPDAELLALAASGELPRPEVLVAQTRRMLRDPKIRELGESFGVQWLRLDQLFAAKPDRKLFPHFYSGPQGLATLHTAALVEPILLFETILIEDRSVLDFINADFTYLNNGVRKLYGFPLEKPSPDVMAARKALPKQKQNQLSQQDEQTWRRTVLSDRTRGGVITMAGPLMATSLPTRTSPVKRGAWILETIFNRPPAEPKVAFALDEKKESDTGKLSTRERFEAHRTQAACYSCHVRLDPPGFALEAFDPIGTVRTVDNGVPVDAAGQWNGRDFNGPAEFKAAVMLNPREFTRGFIEHLLAYALGRRLEHFDVPAVAAIERATAAQDHRFSAVITAIVTSHPFRFTRNLPEPLAAATP